MSKLFAVVDQGFNYNNLLTLYTLTDEGMKYAK